MCAYMVAYIGGKGSFKLKGGSRNNTKEVGCMVRTLTTVQMNFGAVLPID